MAMQVVNPQKPEHLRAFNPDRDMIWAMPRLIRRVFERMGELTEEHLYHLLLVYGLCSPDKVSSALENSKEIVQGIARMFNLMKQFPHKVEEHKAEYKRLAELDPRFMTLIGAMLMDSIFAELPTWFDQVRPKSKLAPSPEVEEIENAANEFLDRIGR